jgi:hypothetical protein
MSSSLKSYTVLQINDPQDWLIITDDIMFYISRVSDTDQESFSSYNLLAGSLDLVSSMEVAVILFRL